MDSEESALIKIEQLGDEQELRILEEKLEIGVDNSIAILLASCKSTRIRMIGKDASL